MVCLTPLQTILLYGVTGETALTAAVVYSTNLTVYVHTQPDLATDPTALVCARGLHTLQGMRATPIVCPPNVTMLNVSYVTLQMSAASDVQLGVMEMSVLREAGKGLMLVEGEARKTFGMVEHAISG